MMRATNGVDDRCTQFVPASEGWLALFEEVTPKGIEIHAEPVIAWALGARSSEDPVGAGPVGQAVVGAGPWVDKAEAEEVTHFFTLVREEQLDPEFLAELKLNAYRSRESIMQQAEQNRIERGLGHSSWMRDRRTTLRSVRLQRRALGA